MNPVPSNLPMLSLLNVQIDKYWIAPLPANSPLPYISRTAEKRVRDELPKQTVCPSCGGEVRLVNNQEIYGKSVGLWPFAYSCQSCDSYCSVHADTDIPMGTIANKALRDMRSRSKENFFRVITANGLNRALTYHWLARQLGIRERDCHFGWFDLPQCTRANQILIAQLEALTK